MYLKYSCASFGGGKLLVIICLICSLISCIYVLPGILSFISENFNIKINYRKKAVYNSAGIFFTLNILFMCMAILVLNSLIYPMPYMSSQILVITSGILSASFAGYIDDTASSPSKGISGHMRSLFNGNLTSGTIKAMVGISVSLIISLSGNYSIMHTVLNFLLICLMQNFINLMDLRPGRAIKAYMILSVISSMFIASSTLYLSINSGILLSFVFYLKYEINEVCMMGDAGSNALGIFMGIACASSGSIAFKLFMVIFLALAHIYSEFASISSLIDRVPALKILDMMGRREK